MLQSEIIAIAVGVSLSVLCAIGIKYVDSITASKITEEVLDYEPLIRDDLTTARLNPGYSPDRHFEIKIASI